MAQRRTYLVDRRFQLKLIFQLVAWGVVIAALFGLWIWQAHGRSNDVLASSGVARSLVERADGQLLWTVAGIALLSAVALGLFGFILGHRLAGPLHVVGVQLRALAKGQFPRRRNLRKSDELKAFFSEFLDSVETLREREVRHTAILQDVLGRMVTAAQRAPELNPAIAVLAEELRSRQDALMETGISGVESPDSPEAGEVGEDDTVRAAATRH
jgi:methyl-accepting chemotaxis protein